MGKKANMSGVEFLMTVRGEFLIRVDITDGMELALFRNDEESFEIFEIKVLTSPLKGQSRIFNLAQHYCDEKIALKEFKEILKELKAICKG